MKTRMILWERDGVTFVKIQGRLALGDGVHSFRETIDGLLLRGPRSVLLDLGDVTYLDSSGLGEIVAAFTKIAQAGGEAKLLHVNRRVLGPLQVAKLYTVFETFDDVAAGVSSFRKERRRTASQLAEMHPEMFRG
jgi:anti-sigma B factor antagonist